MFSFAAMLANNSWCIFNSFNSIMPDTEIKSHTDALSKKLLKPKQQLGEEVGMHFSKINIYAPEVLGKGLGPAGLPWNNAEDLAGTIQSLNRADLLKAWDNVVAGKKRARVVSHVYGSTFPLLDGKQGDFALRNSKQVVNLLSTKEIQEKRQTLAQYSDKTTIGRQRFPFMQRIFEKKVGIAVGLVGASVILCAMNAWGRKGSAEKTTTRSSKKF